MTKGQTSQGQFGMPKALSRGNGWWGVLPEPQGEFTRHPVSREKAFLHSLHRGRCPAAMQGAE